jgi:hypothetical protein
MELNNKQILEMKMFSVDTQKLKEQQKIASCLCFIRLTSNLLSKLDALKEDHKRLDAKHFY